MRCRPPRSNERATGALGGLGPEMESVNALLADARERTTTCMRAALSDDAVKAQLTSMRRKMLP
ncbi:MAG: hypothetical protein ABR591_05285 [Candidatus Velthaea sp.]